MYLRLKLLILCVELVPLRVFHREVFRAMFYARTAKGDATYRYQQR